MYAFLSGCKPARDPGGAYEYSNLAVGLLGHVLALRAGSSYEALLIDRISTPLGMADTRITLSDDQRRRLAPGHDGDGTAVANWDIPTFAGAGAIRSTTNDMAKFVAAQVGLTKVDADLAAAIEMTHARRANGRAGDGHGLGLAYRHEQQLRLAQRPDRRVSQLRRPTARRAGAGSSCSPARGPI